MRSHLAILILFQMCWASPAQALFIIYSEESLREMRREALEDERLIKKYDAKEHWQRAVETHPVAEGVPLTETNFDDWVFEHSLGRFELWTRIWHEPDSAGCDESEVTLYFLAKMRRIPAMRAGKMRWLIEDKPRSVELERIHVLPCPIYLH